MKKLVWSIVITLVLVGGGYFIYPRVFPETNPDVWVLVPGNALAVYESNQVVRVWNRVSQLENYRNLSEVPFVDELNKRIIELDSLAGKGGQLDQVLTGHPFLVSIHVVSKDQVGYLFYIPLHHPASEATAERVINSIEGQRETRVYQGHQIQEIKSKNGGTFAFTKLEKTLIGSFTPILVEDAIRQVGGDESEGFRALNQDVFKLAKLENDQGNLYFNTSRLNQLMSVYGFDADLPILGKTTFLDVAINDRQALLTGFTASDRQNLKQFLNVFDGVSPERLRMEDLIPNHTSFLLHLTFADRNRFMKNLGRYTEATDPGHRKRLDSINQSLDLDLNRMFEWFGSEIGLITLESINPKSPQRLLVIGTSDHAEALNQLNRLAESINVKIEDSLYRESFGQIPITQLYLDEFPGTLLGPQFKGFENCFFAPLNDYMVFGNSVESIKILLNDMSLENTWGKSVSQSSYLESILQEANLSMIINTRHIWSAWSSQLRPGWAKFLQDNRAVLRDYDQFALQFGFIDDKYYTSLDLHFDPSLLESVAPSGFDIVQDTQLDTLMISKPFVVRNHLDRSFETLVQDAHNSLIFLSSEGAKVWSDSLPGPIIGSVSQLDYYQNGKLQYFFATENAVHIIDRNGHYVPDFPLELDFSIDKVSLIDYDRSGAFRFLISTSTGQVYMYNKAKENLEGWQGKELGARLSSSPYHIRVRNRDCLVFGLEDGRVYLTNRRGENFLGFPLKFESAIDNPIFVEVGSSFSNTIFSTITAEGEMVRFNLKGEVAGRVQYYKPSQEVTFQLIPDALNRTFVIARQELNRLSILDRRGELVFEKDYLTFGKMVVQFYSFGSDEVYYAVTDKEQEFTYLYDREGNLINFQPFESGFKIALLKRAGNKFQAHAAYHNGVMVYGFSR